MQFAVIGVRLTDDETLLERAEHVSEQDELAESDVQRELCQHPAHKREGAIVGVTLAVRQRG